jgi:DNA-binding response OmpR family regulator
MDDDDVVRRGLVRMLERAGHTATPAAAAAEARALARSFDLGIMDINLGPENGLVVAREFLAAGIIARVVFFSSETEPRVVAEDALSGPRCPQYDGPARNPAYVVKRCRWRRSNRVRVGV